MLHQEVRCSAEGSIGTTSNASLAAFRTSRQTLAAHNLPMPALSPTMTEGTISKWLLKEGSLTLDRLRALVADDLQAIPIPLAMSSYKLRRTRHRWTWRLLMMEF
jgi:hypothetical protein